MNEKLGKQRCDGHGFMILHPAQNIIQQTPNATRGRVAGTKLSHIFSQIVDCRLNGQHHLIINVSNQTDGFQRIMGVYMMAVPACVQTVQPFRLASSKITALPGGIRAFS